MTAGLPTGDVVSPGLAIPLVLAVAELAAIGLVRRHRGGYSFEFHLMGLLLAVDMGLVAIWLFDGPRVIVVASYLLPAGYLAFALSGWVWSFLAAEETGPHRPPAPRWLAAVALISGLSVWAAHGVVLVSGADVDPAGTGWPFVDGFALSCVSLGGYVLVDREEAVPASRPRNAP